MLKAKQGKARNIWLGHARTRRLVGSGSHAGGDRSWSVDRQPFSEPLFVDTDAAICWAADRLS